MIFLQNAQATLGSLPSVSFKLRKLRVVIAIFAVRPIIFAVRCMFVPTTNKQSPQKETGSESKATPKNLDLENQRLAAIAEIPFPLMRLQVAHRDRNDLI